MTRSISAFSLLAVLLLTSQGNAEPLEYIGKPIGGIPVSSVVKVGKSLFVSGMMPASDPSGELWGNFPAQMKQVMDISPPSSKALGPIGAAWSRQT